MARLESQADLLHVPTPPAVIAALSGILALPDSAQSIDPCCGSGEALQALAAGRGRTYGVELEISRATAAATRLSRVLACAMQEARVSRDCFSLALVNPPYADSTDGRLEVQFLERATNWLRPGGVLVLIIKAPHYTGRINAHLARHYRDFRHRRFPDPYYTGPELAFTQTVLLARKRAQPVFPSQDDLWSLRHDPAKPLPALSAGDGTYDVPGGEPPAIFLSGHLTPEAAMDLLAVSTVRRVPAKRGDMRSRPLLPLKPGHLALLLASGAIDGVYGTGAQLHVAKGTVRRGERSEKFIDLGATGDVRSVTVRETLGFEIVVRALTPDGKIHDISAPKPEASEAQIIEAGLEEAQAEEE